MHTKNAPRTKARPTATKNKSIQRIEEAHSDELVPKIKKPFDIELPEEPLLVDEKAVDEDAPATEDGEEVASEEAALDDDELNPFGDKWEQ